MYELIANQAQRRVRACILALIPGDVIDGAMQQAEVTLRTKADTSPEAMGKMVEAFQTFGVTREHIEKRIQRRLDTIQPAQVIMLKRVYASLRDDMSVPADWFEMEGTQATAKPKVDMPTAKAPPAQQAHAPAAAPAAKVDQDTGEIHQQHQQPAEPKKAPVEYPAGSMATEGERKLIITRARNNNLDILDLIDQAGLSGLPPDLAGLTKDGFVALKDQLPKAA